MADIWRGSNVASGVLTTADLMSLNATGGTETSNITTAPSDFSTVNFMEMLSQGGTGTDNAALPAPSGKGWISGTQLEGQTIPAGNWSAIIACSDVSGSSTGCTLVIRFYKRTSAGVYTAIGSITLTAQTVGTTRTQFSMAATAMSAVSFGSGDKLYVDRFNTKGAGWNADAMHEFVSNSSTAGVASDLEITTPTHVSTGTTVDKETTYRGKISQTSNKETTYRGKVSKTTQKETTYRANIGRGPGVKDTTYRGKVSKTIGKETTYRGQIARPAVHETTYRGALGHGIAKETTYRGNIIRSGPTSGGFALYASGTGVASFDDFRVTPYPDPALACEQAGRAGSSYVGWNSILPSSATTLGIDTSIRGDGTDWVEVTAQNGGPIPGIYTQPQPTTDGFSIDTSALYTSTFRTGGSAATVTYDTVNSRLLLSGGSTAVYSLNSIARADIDEMVILDESDAGGLVFRFVDQSNFYRLVIADDSSNVGTASRLTLYKVLANVETQLAQATISFPRGTYHALRVSMLLGVITASFDGALTLSYTDASPLGAGNLGLYNDGGAVGSRYYMLWVQPQGDLLLNTYVYTRQRETTTDTTVTPQLLDITTSVKSPAIESGPVIPQLHQLNKPFAEYIDKEIQSLADTADKWWGMDDNKGLSFRDRQAIPAPWPVSESDLIAFTVLPAYSGDAYRNRQVITNVIDTLLAPQEQKVADGSATSWALGYRLAAAPVITIGSAIKSVGMKGIDTNKDFYWQLDDVNIVQDSNAPVLASGIVITIAPYLGNFDTLCIRDNLPEQALRASIEQGTSGIIENVIDGGGIPMSAAITIADGLLARYAKTAVTLAGSTRRWGLLPGMLANFFILSYPLMFDRQLLVTKVKITPTIENGNTVYLVAIEATDGAAAGSWARVL